jgi:hypothetical protein
MGKYVATSNFHTAKGSTVAQDIYNPEDMKGRIPEIQNSI